MKSGGDITLREAEKILEYPQGGLSIAFRLRLPWTRSIGFAEQDPETGKWKYTLWRGQVLAYKAKGGGCV